jgi:uncharacterized protein
MLIDISTIGPDGLSVRGEVPLDRLRLEGSLEALLTRPRLDARFTAGRRGITLEAHLDTRLTLTCVRCLAPYEVPLSHDFTLTLVVEAPRPEAGAAPAGGSDRDARTDELDLFPIRGNQVDLTEVVREQIDLCIPMNPVCRSDCPGLCARCGASLDDGPCGCPSESSDPRWAALKAWQDGREKA